MYDAIEIIIKNYIEILLYVNIRPQVDLDLNRYEREHKEEH